jgi:hypothetical protein
LAAAWRQRGSSAACLAVAPRREVRAAQQWRWQRAVRWQRALPWQLPPPLCCHQ